MEPQTRLEHPKMAAPLRSLRSSLRSSSYFGSHLRPRSTPARSMTCFLTTRPPASFPRPRGAATRLPGARTVPESDFRMGVREPRTRLLSSAAAPLFGDTIIVTKRCAQVNATAVCCTCTLSTVSGRYCTPTAPLSYYSCSICCCWTYPSCRWPPPPHLVSGVAAAVVTLR